MKATIEQAMQASAEALEEANMIWKNRLSWRTAISRAFFSVFYAAHAMLETKKLSYSSHSGQIFLFNQHFVQPGIIAKKFGTTLGRLFSKRLICDHDLLARISEQEVEEALTDAQAFVDEVKNYLISNRFWSQP